MRIKLYLRYCNCLDGVAEGEQEPNELLVSLSLVWQSILSSHNARSCLWYKYIGFLTNMLSLSPFFIPDHTNETEKYEATKLMIQVWLSSHTWHLSHKHVSVLTNSSAGQAQLSLNGLPSKQQSFGCTMDVVLIKRKYIWFPIIKREELSTWSMLD